jgi:hypothetical protein
MTRYAAATVARRIAQENDMPTTHTIVVDEDCSGIGRIAWAVMAPLGAEITLDTGASTSGFQRLDIDWNTTGSPVTGITKWAALATFSIDDPPEEVTLVVNTNTDVATAFLPLGIGPL